VAGPPTSTAIAAALCYPDTPVIAFTGAAGLLPALFLESIRGLGPATTGLLFWPAIAAAAVAAVLVAVAFGKPWLPGVALVGLALIAVALVALVWFLPLQGAVFSWPFAQGESAVLLRGAVFLQERLEAAGAVLIGALTMTVAGAFLLDPRRIVLGALLFAIMELVFVIVPGFGQSVLLLIVMVGPLPCTRSGPTPSSRCAPPIGCRAAWSASIRCCSSG